MFVSLPLFLIMLCCSLFCAFCLIVAILWYGVTLYERHQAKLKLREDRLLKIEENIRYLKGIGGIENE